jgi:hydroxymethylglutaryl-CoA lyase
LADTVGTAKSEDVAYLFKEIHRLWPQLEIGAHFHAKPNAWSEKIDAAFQNGCRRFDGAILGFGGCPFANDELTGNIPTEGLIQWFSGQAIAGVNILEMQTAMNMANGIFNRH